MYIYDACNLGVNLAIWKAMEVLHWISADKIIQIVIRMLLQD